MEETRLTSPKPRKWILGIGVLLVLGGLVKIIANLEQQRSRSLADETVRLEEAGDGTVISARVVTPDVTDRQWEFIKSYDELRWLFLSETSSCEGGLREVGSLPQLERLALDQASWVDDDGLADLEATQLEHLFLDGTQVTDACLPTLRRLGTLQSVSFEACEGITDGCLDDLQQMPSLKWVVLTETGVSLDGFERLRSSRPDLTIQADIGVLTKGQITIDVAQNGDCSLQSRAEIGLLKRILSMQHDWITGEPGSLSFDHIKSLSLVGPSAEEAFAMLAPLLPSVSVLSIPAVSLSKTGDRMRGELKTLVLDRVSETTDLGPLAMMPALGSLRLQAESPVTPDVLDVVQQLPILNSLILIGEGFSDKSLAPLAHAHSLRSLALVGVPLSAASIEPLLELPLLSTLQLRTDSPVTAKVLGDVVQLSALRSLTLSGPGFSDSALLPLRRAESLDSITIDGAPISDAGVEPLFNLTGSQQVRVTRTQVSEEMQDRLREHFTAGQSAPLLP